MVNVRRPVGLAAVKCHLERCTPQHEDGYPPYQSIKKAPIWERAEWGSFRSILDRLVLELELETNDKALHTMHVERHISRDGESIQGQQVMFVEMVKRALPEAFTNRRFHMLCFVMGRTAVCVVHILIICKINVLWLIP